MSLEFDGITFPSAAARELFINMDKAAQQKWRDQFAPVTPPDGVDEGMPRVESPPVPDHAMSNAEWRESTVVAEARKLMAHGFHPVLVRPDTKKPPRSYDQDTVTCEADFKRLIDNGEGKVTKQWLGARLGNGNHNVDVDCDWPEAIAVLPIITNMGLLPQTASFGKPNDPRPTHYMYACTDGTNRQFLLPELDNASDPRFPKAAHKLCILELRANHMKADGTWPKRLTVMPPSAGRAWRRELPMAKVSGPLLDTLMSVAALTCLFVRCYPAEAEQGECRMTFASVLVEVCGDKLTPDQIDSLVFAAAKLAPANERTTKEARAQSAIDRKTAGENTFGIPHLIKLLALPDAMADRVRAWFDMTADQQPGSCAEPNDDGRPTIKYRDENMDALLTETQDAMLACETVNAYQRGGMLVYPYRLRDETTRRHTTTQQGTLVIERAVAHRVIHLMTRAARFERYSARSRKWIPACPPVEFAQSFLAWKPEWQFPILHGISDVPLLRADGSICALEGYDAESMMLLDFGGQTYPDIPEHPTKADGEAAIRVFDVVLMGFPFDANKNGLVKCASRSVALSVFLSALISQILEAVPHHLFGSPEARSGKTLVIQCAGIVATGRLPPAMSHTGREEEDEKRLVGAYMQGGPIILIDNVKKGSKISGDFLCASITGSSTSCRKLGFTGQTTVPTNSMICSSGNNIGVEGDMAERTIACTIDAQMEQPGTRKFEVDLHAYCLQHRGEIVAACLTILRAFVVAPDRNLTLDGMIAMGGFKPWSEMVRAALIWLGEADPIASMDSLRSDDPESASLADLMVSWRDCPALGLNHWFDCGQVMAEAANETTGLLLKSALDRIFAPPKKPSEIGLGMYLGKFGRRIICLSKQNLRFEHQTEGGTRRSQYRLATVLEQGSLDLGRKD